MSKMPQKYRDFSQLHKLLNKFRTAFFSINLKYRNCKINNVRNWSSEINTKGKINDKITSQVNRFYFKKYLTWDSVAHSIYKLRDCNKYNKFRENLWKVQAHSKNLKRRTTNLEHPAFRDINENRKSIRLTSYIAHYQSILSSISTASSLQILLNCCKCVKSMTRKDNKNQFFFSSKEIDGGSIQCSL